MKKALFFIATLMLICFFACQKNDVTAPDNHNNVITDTLAGKWELKILDSGRIGHIYDIQCISKQTVYMCTSHGYFVKSTDAGQTWTKKLVPNQEPLTQICFLDSLNGYILGDDNHNLRNYYVTTDAGNTWTKKHITLPWSSSGVIDLIFINKAVGFATIDSIYNDLGYVIKTVDSGKTWTKKYLTAKATKIYFASALKGWIIDYYGDVHETYDGGENWRQVTSGSGNPLFYPTDHGFHAFDTGNFVSGNFAGVTFHKRTAGYTQYDNETYTLPPFNDNPVSVYMTSKNKGYTFFADGTIVKFDRNAPNPMVVDTIITEPGNTFADRWIEMNFYDSSFGIIGGNAGRYLVKH